MLLADVFKPVMIALLNAILFVEFADNDGVPAAIAKLPLRVCFAFATGVVPLIKILSAVIDDILLLPRIYIICE
ncbi:hypothetical protein D6_00103 [Faustovirus]|nr:hypothetical protein D6_00103 [Faustovirus]